MASVIRIACTVSATSCARMICTPAATARQAHASAPGNRAASSAPNSFRSEGFGHPNRLHSLRDIVRADDLHARGYRQAGARQRSRQPCRKFRAQQLPDKGLARDTEQHWALETCKTPCRPKQLQIVLNRLPKADPGVEYNLVPAYSAIAQSPDALGKEFPDLAHHVGVNRLGLHRLGCALRMHADVAGTRLGHEPP